MKLSDCPSFRLAIRLASRPMVVLAMVAVVSLAPAVPVFGQRDFSGVEIKATHVGGRVYMLEGRGGNIGLSVGDDGVLMVDDQFKPLSGKIKAAMEKLSSGKLRYVLNTHWHGDHTGGNVVFGREALIVSHENVRERLSTQQVLFGEKKEPLPKEGLPVVTFDHAVSVHFNGEEVRMVHFPNGHTDGDGVVYFTESNVVHMGDLYFAGMFPFVDLDHGGDVEGLARNVFSVLEGLAKDVRIIPGHGSVTGVEKLKEYHRMLVETIAYVRKGMATGRTLEDLKEAGVPEAWKSWGDGFIKTGAWVETIHTSLSRK